MLSPVFSGSLGFLVSVLVFITFSIQFSAHHSPAQLILETNWLSTVSGTGACLLVIRFYFKLQERRCIGKKIAFLFFTSVNSALSKSKTRLVLQHSTPARFPFQSASRQSSRLGPTYTSRLRLMWDNKPYPSGFGFSVSSVKRNQFYESAIDFGFT